MRFAFHGPTLLLVLLILAPPARSQDWDYSRQSSRRVHAWSEVVDIVAKATRADRNPGTGRFDGDPTLHLSPQGRFVMLHQSESDVPSSDPEPNWAGRFRRTGKWLELHIEGQAFDPERMVARQREEFEAWMARQPARVEIPMAELDGSRPSRRLLIVPVQDGVLLLDETHMRHSASTWDGEGPLDLYPTAWRMAGLFAPEPGLLPKVDIANPLDAALPIELKSLLRRSPVVARVTDVPESAATLSWRHHEASMRLRLDRGEQHGLYDDITLYGLPPDERLQVRLTEVHRDHSIAELQLRRFASTDSIEVPGVGLQLATRPADPTACVVDNSAALRALVVGDPVDPDELLWDAEGYAWFELTIDQGRAQGLVMEDVVRAEDRSLRGEGRIRALESNRSTVLWRAFRRDRDETVRVPQPGELLVTPPWQRVEDEVFGKQ